MIVDCHTHVGEYPAHIEDRFLAQARAAWGDELELGITRDEHRREALRDADAAVVLAFNAPASGYVVPNEYVAEYVATDRARLFGFGSVDPHDPAAIAELERFAELGLVGCKMAPIYQDIDPRDERFMAICGACERLRLPMLIHQGTTFATAGSLMVARPVLLDDVCRAFPELRVVIAHVGHPWVDEAVAVVRRHRHCYADVSALASRPWQLYQALLCAVEYRVEHKLLFGTDFPFFTVEETIRTLRAATGWSYGPGMPMVEESVVEQIIQRPTLELLGIA